MSTDLPEHVEPSTGFTGLLSNYWDKAKKLLGNQYRQHATGVLKCGPMPRHIAFIMDGNRRFARKLHQEVKEGHSMGGETLKETLRWCLELGITTVTVFAFSIENYKRATEEVDALMKIAYSKLGDLLAASESKKYFRINGIGDMSLLPVELQERIKAIQEHTKDNKGGDFNVCFSYSGTNEITSAVKQVIHDTVEGSNSERLCVAESDLERCLQLYGSPDLDMIVRTSGEIRLSDFMLWQASACCLAITDVLWPEFTPNHLYASVLYFQEHHDNLMAIRATLLAPQTVDDMA